MALDVFIAGRYSHTYNSVDTGITRDGFELQQDSRAEEISETDLAGETLIDFVYRGGRVTLQYNGKAYKAGALTPFWPWGAMGVLGVIGRLASDVALASVLTSTAGTPAATAPASLTGTKAILAPNNPARLLFSSKVREVPVRLELLAYDSGGGALKWFTSTIFLLATFGLAACGMA